MRKLHAIVNKIMLQRTKGSEIDGKPILQLPERTVEVVRAEFNPEQKA